MSAIYVTEPGSQVRVSSRQVIVTKGKEQLLSMPLIKVERLLLFGPIQVTAQAVNILMDEGVDITYLSSKGRFRGKIQPAESKNVLVRVAQYERFLNEEFTVELARAFVSAKVSNGRALILRYQRNYPDMDFSAEIKSIENNLNKLEKQNSVATIMGMEGTSTATYFKAFGKMFRTEFRFDKRTRRPPKDPVNAVLSFGYTMLTNEVFSLISAHGLDPYIGFLHGLSYGRPSLALDLVEEFRHPFIDRFTLSLFNNNVFVKEDFHAVENEGIYFTEEAVKRYFGHYERRIKEVFKIENTEKEVTFRQLFKIQIQKLGQAILKNIQYEPYKIYG